MQRRRAAHGALFAFGVVAVILPTPPAAALDKVKVGIPATEAFSFMAVDFGNDRGVYAKNGVEVERVVSSAVLSCTRL